MRLPEKRIAISIVFIGALCLAGLAGIRFIFVHPSLIGPFALMIGMTPLVVFFEYCPPVPSLFFFIGSGIAIGALALLLIWPPHPAARRTGIVSLYAGGCTVALSVSICVIATIYYNVGMAGDLPPGWIACVRAGAGVGDVGFLLVFAGFLLSKTMQFHGPDPLARTPRT